MYKTILCLTSTLSVVQLHAATVSTTLGLISDYRSAGISQTSGNPAVQGHIDVTFENGIYANAWASHVDWGDDAKLELDYYLGYSAALSKDIGYDFSVGYVSYPDYSLDINYPQAIAKLHYKNASVAYSYSSNYSNSGKNAGYISLDYSQPLPKKLSLNLHAGRSMGAYWENMYCGEYNDYSVGFAGSFHGLDLSLAWISTDIHPHTHSGALQDDSTIVFGISHTF